jgi:diguanylate cyclase (GGDEF)-like protein
VVGKPLEEVIVATQTDSGNPLDSQMIATAVGDGRTSDCNLDMVDSNGKPRSMECRICPLATKPGAAARGAVIVINDVTEQLKLKSELVRWATTDDLTGLMNRRQFDVCLQRAVDSARENDVAHCLCYMDLDQFKVVNDTCGHVAGDELLHRVAKLLRDQVRHGDDIARLGGDEFALLLSHCTVEQGARVTEKLLQALQEFRFVWEDRVFSIGISIGVIAIDAHSASGASVLADADAACYAAKDAGRNRIHIAHPADDELADRRTELQLVNQINDALTNDRFALFTQAIRPLNEKDDPGVHFEVLVRMLDAGGTLRLPGHFLPTAERFDLASGIDRWVVVATLQHLEQHPSLCQRIGQCSINLSGQSLGDQQFESWLTTVLDGSTVSPGKLCFEVTETAAIANLSHARALMSTLRARGCRWALDDFGSGFSSLAYLKSLPFDYLKIDGLFVRDIVDDEQDLAMVRLINEISKTMKMKTIAEFVEHDEIRQLLANLGVDYGQGYSIQEPQPIEALEKTLAADSA